MTITAAEIEREKRALPFGWGRFGKAFDHLRQISRRDESLLAAVVALNPDYQYKPEFVPGSPLAGASALREMTKTTNVVMACTNLRLIMLGTGAGGAPREHIDLSYEGLELVSTGRKEFVIGLPEGQIRIRGASKQHLPEFLEVLERQARPGGYEELTA